jgi:tetratricopeptide (TPR) repeat protein
MIEAVNVMVDEGRLAEALALCERIVTLAKEAGDPVVVGWGLCRVGNINSITGDQVRAEQALRAGIDSLLAALQPADAVSGFGWLALCLLRQGRADEAVALLGEQDERIHRYGIAGYFLRGFHAASALIGLAAAERVEAAERKAALHDAGGACRALRKVGKADICSMVTAYRLEGTYAWLRGHRRRAESHWRSSLAQAERLGARYEGALTEFEVGRLTGDPAALQRAAAAFASTGARFDLARTQELLRGACREPAVSG